jgi:hypothetical protein
MIYKFRDRDSIKGMDPQTVGEELESIRRRHEGKLRTEDVLSSARHKASALHPAFTWDDEKAAHEFRLNEARRLIRAIGFVLIVRQSTSNRQRKLWLRN